MGKEKELWLAIGHYTKSIVETVDGVVVEASHLDGTNPYEPTYAKKGTKLKDIPSAITRGSPILVQISHIPTAADRRMLDFNIPIAGILKLGGFLHAQV